MAGTSDREEMAVDCSKESAMKKELFEKSECLIAQQLPRTEFDEVSCVSRQSAPPCCKRVAGKGLNVLSEKQRRGWRTEPFLSWIESRTGRADFPRDTYSLTKCRTSASIGHLYLHRYRAAEGHAVCRHYRQLERRASGAACYRRRKDSARDNRGIRGELLGDRRLNYSPCHGKRWPEKKECEHDADEIEPWVSSLYEIDCSQTSQNSKGEHCRSSCGSSR